MGALRPHPRRSAAHSPPRHPTSSAVHPPSADNTFHQLSIVIRSTLYRSAVIPPQRPVHGRPPPGRAHARALPRPAREYGKTAAPSASSPPRSPPRPRSRSAHSRTHVAPLWRRAAPRLHLAFPAPPRPALHAAAGGRSSRCSCAGSSPRRARGAISGTRACPGARGRDQQLRAVFFSLDANTYEHGSAAAAFEILSLTRGCMVSIGSRAHVNKYDILQGVRAYYGGQQGDLECTAWTRGVWYGGRRKQRYRRVRLALERMETESTTLMKLLTNMSGRHCRMF
ncbi:hypothetical protein BJ912DRAFT_181358 [Pholiota molesta]|nr:hypothetical protein BJ912DRAFT_181358 [Pholiota molesta]